jgi:hypothetical protein
VGTAGVVSPRYTFVEEVWASFEPGPSVERNVGEAPQHDADGVFGFHETVTVTEDMALKVGADVYRVLGIPDHRAQFPNRIRRVRAVRADKEVYDLVG